MQSTECFFFPRVVSRVIEETFCFLERMNMHRSKSLSPDCEIQEVSTVKIKYLTVGEALGVAPYNIKLGK